MPLNQKTAFRILVAAFMLQAISVGYYAFCVWFYGYLPSPFVMDKSDTFMDLYNTMWWGAHDGRYTEWQSIYPPLNFMIVGLMQVVFVPSGVGSDPAYLRATSLWPAYVVIALHVIAPAFIVTRSTWNGFSSANRTLIALTAMLSPIFLFSIERGNLIILPIFCLPFIFAERDGWWKPFLLAIIINLKPYLVLLVFGYAFVGDWRRFLQSVAFAGAIFLLSGLLEDPNFLLFLKNIPNFAGNVVLQPQWLLTLPASPSALTRAILMLVYNPGTPISHSTTWALLPPLIEALKSGAIVLALLGLFRCRRAASSAEAFGLLLILAVTAGIWAGGYSQIFYVAAIPAFMGMRFRSTYLLLLLAIFLPWDLVTLHTDPPLAGQSFITHENVSTSWQLGLGSLVRPFLNLTLITILGTELIMRKNPSKGQATNLRALDLIPDWRLVLPAGVAGLVMGATLYSLAISSKTAVTVIKTGVEAEQSDPQRFLHLYLQHRTTPQLVVARLQTFSVANRIADELGDPGIARNLAGQQYGGDGGLTARLSNDTRYLEIRAVLSNPTQALKAAAAAADIAVQTDAAALSRPPVQVTNRISTDWQTLQPGTAVNAVIADQLVDLRDPSVDDVTTGRDLQERRNAQVAIFRPATLSRPMIDSWWLGALVGCFACGSLGYTVGLSRTERRHTT